MPVFKEFKNPRNPEFSEPTRYSLLNAFTETIKKYTPLPENELFSSMLFWKSLIFALLDAAYLVRRVLKLNLDPTYHKLCQRYHHLLHTSTAFYQISQVFDGQVQIIFDANRPVYHSTYAGNVFSNIGNMSPVC